QRQLCWAQLRRGLVAWSERAGETARIGLAVLAVEKQLFAFWYRVRGGTVAWADFQVAMLAVMARGRTLLQGEGSGGRPQSPGDVSESAQTGRGLVDVCVGARCRPHK